MTYGLSRIQLRDSRLDFTELPLLLLYISGYGFGCQKGLGTFRAPGQRIQPLLRR
jgi:hypothetical protein